MMRRLSLSSGLVLIFLASSGLIFAQSSGSTRCHGNGNILVSGDNFGPPAAAAPSGSWIPMQPVQKFELEIGGLDLDQRVITLHNPAEDKSYSVKVDKSLKLTADKRVLRRKPELADFSRGDRVKATVNLMESRVLEIKLLKSRNRQD